MKLACQNCGGTGRSKDETGHPDVCPECLGLGYVDSESEREDANTSRRSRKFYILASISAVLLGLYYVGLYVAVMTFGFTTLITMIFFVGGHLAIFGGVMLYALSKVLRNSDS